MVECRHKPGDYTVIEDENGIFFDQITEVDFDTKHYKFNQLHVFTIKTSDVVDGFVGDCEQDIYVYEKDSRPATNIEILLYS